MTEKALSFHPLMGELLDENNTVSIDLSSSNFYLRKIDLMDLHAFDDFVFQNLNNNKKIKYAIGGYGENRAIYARSQVFNMRDSVYRNIHLGIDIWSFSGTPIYCPLEGKIHSFQDNIGFGNYGPTIILEHQLKGNTIYSLYGHLTRWDLKTWEIDTVLEKGQLIGRLGTPDENGAWPPHLHFQLVNCLGNYKGDYPGVCGEIEKLQYLKNCPNPNNWIGCSLLESINN
ncbi:MAG: peptidoglycan DD-metalloendopeptidase family protein [Cyclobacteriaceae bacterium]